MFSIILKESFFIFIFKVIGTSLFFYTNILIAKKFGPEAFGIFNLFITSLIFLSLINRMGMEFIIPKELTKRKDDINYMYSYFINIILLISFLTLLNIFILFLLNIFYDISKYIGEINLIVILITSLSLSVMIVVPEFFRVYGSTKIYSLYKNMLVQILFFISVLFILYNKVSIDISIIYSYAIIGSAILLILNIFILFYKKNQNYKPKYENKYYPKIKLLKTMFLISIFLFLQGNLDLYMIESMMTTIDVGYYSVIVKIASIMTFITATVGNTISIKLASGDYLTADIFKQTLKIILLTTIPLLSSIFIFSEEILLLFGNNYIHLSSELRNISIVVLLNSFPIGYFFVMLHKEHIFLVIVFISFIINFVLNLIFIPKYGINGAIIASLISIIIWNLSSFMYLKLKKQI